MQVAGRDFLSVFKFHYSQLFHAYQVPLDQSFSWPVGQDFLDFADLVGQFLAVEQCESVFSKVMIFSFIEHHIYKMPATQYW
jgi:hypothetical protein